MAGWQGVAPPRTPCLRRDSSRNRRNAMINDDTVEVLNGLISMSEDGRKGFVQAADEAQDANLKTLFQDRARQCSQAVDELQTLVNTLGGKPSEDGSLTGTAHRAWVKFRVAVGDNNLAVLEEVERGEDHAKAAYKSALRGDLPPMARGVLEKQDQGVVANHDRIRDLRNRYRNAA